MCGIVGFRAFGGTRRTAGATVERMAALLFHRGPDDEGAWSDADSGIALAQRRLSIVDLSPAGHQPMLSASGRYMIVYNGEIYNYEELRSDLDSSSQIAWRGHSDTEVLLAAIERWGLKGALGRCTGMFAIALWDKQERKLFLARDRIGEKPLYYGWVGDAFVFGSELKAFAGFPTWSPIIDRDSVALLMRHNYIPAPYTIYKGINKLRPGHVLELSDQAYRNRTPHVEPYWRAADAAERGRAAPFSGNKEDAVEALDSLLRQSLRGQMMADVPLGAFLSGGVDSSTVVAIMQSMSLKPIRTFTIGFHQPDYNEAEHAKEVARHLGTNHTELYVTEAEALDVIPKLPKIYCEPFSDSSQIPTFLVSQLARQEVTVSLSGDGGDELFSGYTRYKLADSFWNRLSRVPAPLRNAASSLATLPSPTTYDRIAGPLMRLAPMAYRRGQIGDKIHKAAELLSLRSSADVYRRLCSHWTTPEELVVGGNEKPTMLTGFEKLPELAGNVERMMFTDVVSYLPDDILVKVDRAAMAVSLETRVPLLDHRIVEFALSLPLQISRADNTPKWPLKQLLNRHVPKNLIDRPKMGFGVPIDTWLRGKLRPWAEALLDPSRLRSEGMFNAELVRRTWEEHLSGRRNCQYLLWDVLMFQAWHQEHSSAVRSNDNIKLKPKREASWIEAEH